MWPGLTVCASSQRSCLTPGIPLSSLTMALCLAMASSTMSSGSSVCHRHSRPTGFLWCRQQKTHLLAHAREGVASMHWKLWMPYIVCL